jgi:hypothetical protein
MVEVRDAEALQRMKVARAALTRADPSRANLYFIRYNISCVSLVELHIESLHHGGVSLALGAEYFVERGARK